MNNNKKTSLLIHDFPFPPSENSLYRSNRHTGGRCATKLYRNYESAVFSWAISNNQRLPSYRQAVQEFGLLQVKAYFGFQHKRIFTLTGKPKKIDVSNFIKALHDFLCKQLGIDDRQIWKFSGEKFAVPSEHEQRVILSISPTEHRKFPDINFSGIGYWSTSSNESQGG